MDNTSYIPPEKPLGDETAKATPQLGDIISKLMSNPELMGMISSALGKEKDAPSEDAVSVSKQEPPPKNEQPTPSASTEDISAKLPEVMATLAPLLGGSGGSFGEVIKKAEKRDDKRTCLLRAIKPYVSHGRGEAIDYMIRIAGVTEILKYLN